MMAVRILLPMLIAKVMRRKKKTPKLPEE